MARKRYLSAWAAAAALAGAALMGGCAPAGGGGTAGTAPAGGAAPAGGEPGKKIRIGVSIPAADHGWTAGVVWWAKEAQKLHPEIEWTLATAESPDKQIKDLETMMVKGVDGMVVLATESAPITPIAKQIAERGILLVNVDRGFLEPVADVFIEGDNAAFGRKSAEFVAERLNGQGRIVVLEGIPSTVNTDRVNAAMEVFKRYPGIQILDRQSGMWNRQKSLDVMQTMLLKHPQIDAVWAQDDDMALGVEQAIKEAGRTDIKWILGGAGMKDIVKRVMDGDPMFPGNVTYPPSMIALGMHTAASILRDGQRENVMKFTPRHLKIDVDVVTKENAADFYFPDSVY